jgi:hypothetical protein
MASRVFVFVSSISSRSDFIEFHPRFDGLGGMLGLRTVRLQPDLDQLADQSLDQLGAKASVLDLGY